MLQDYSVTLNQTDVSYGIHGHNKFYKIQLLERLDGKKWSVWNCWGRVGAENPLTRVYDFFNKLDAKTFFEGKFFDKTANKWG